MILYSGRSVRMSLTNAEPIKPAPPVMKNVRISSCRFYGLTRTVPFPWFGFTQEKEEIGKLWQAIRCSRLETPPSSSARTESVAIHANGSTSSADRSESEGNHEWLSKR